MALRTPLSVTPHLYMGDSTGRPLDMGTVYFGEQDKDPEFYPIELFSDDALTLPLAQPVHTKGGYLYDKGDMVEPHAKEIIYSVKVLDSYGRKVFYKGAMMRNSWNDDVIEQINQAVIDSADVARQVATDITNDAINNTAVEGGVLADTFVVVDGTLSQRTINKGLESISDLLNIPNPKDGLRVYVKSYHADVISGCGTFIWYANKDKSEHNGGTVIDPLVPFPTAWSNQVEEDGMVSKWFAVGVTGVEGKGCWVRQCGTNVDVSWFGAIDDDFTDNTFSFNAATSAYLPYNAPNFSNYSDRKRTIFVSGTKTAYRVKGTVYVRKGQEIRGTGLGSCRIFVPVTDTVGSSFRLGVGLEYNPFPANPVKTTAGIGSTTVVLSGNPYQGMQYRWFGSGRRVKLDGNFYETESVTFGTDTTIVLTTPLLSTINAGSTLQAAEITDSGGLPPSISNLAIEGGHIYYPVIDGRGTAGMSVNTLFITGASIGIWGMGGDVNIHTVTFDNGGIGLRMSGSRNSITGCHFFWNQVDIQVVDSAYDWVVSNCTFGFYKQYSVGFNSDSGIKDISFNNCNFFMNEQYATAVGAIRVLTGEPRFKVIGCNFSNQKSWSIVSASQSPNVEIEVRQCTFNGTKSHASYIQSTTSSGIFLNTGTLLVVDCLFKNIHSNLIQNNLSGSHVTIKDNLVMDYTGDRPFLKSVALTSGRILLEDNRVTRGTPPLLVNEDLNVTTSTNELVKLVRNNGFYKLQTHSGGRRYVKLPYLRGDSFLIRVKYNGSPSPSPQYRRSAIYAVSTATTYEGAVLDYVTLDSLTTPVGGTIPAALDVQIDIDDVGEGTSKSFKNNDFRHLTISVPADANYFFVELI